MLKAKTTTEIIAEIGQAHDGSLGQLHAYIDAVAATGVNAIKFQTHIAEAESSPQEPFRVKFSKQDSTRFEYWQRMSFSESQWIEIREHCNQVNVEFMSTPFSIAAVELLERVGIQRYKVGSGDLENYLLLDRIVQTSKPILLSTGMGDYQSIAQTIEHLFSARDRLTLMQCTTQYPTPLTDVGLNNLEEYRQRFDLPVGLSDHSGTIYPSAIAAIYGAVVVEVHTVFDKRMFGPDTSSSLTVEELKSLVNFIRASEILQSHPKDKTDSGNYRELKATFGRSLSVNKALPTGHQLTLEDLECKKPANQGIDVKNYQSVVGKYLTKPLEAYSFLKAEDFE